MAKDTVWSYSSSDLSVEDMWGEFHEKLLKLNDKIPVDSIKLNSDGSLNSHGTPPGSNGREGIRIRHRLFLIVIQHLVI